MLPADDMPDFTSTLETDHPRIEAGAPSAVCDLTWTSRRRSHVLSPFRIPGKGKSVQSSLLR